MKNRIFFSFLFDFLNVYTIFAIGKVETLIFFTLIIKTKRMNKTELIEKIAAASGLSKADSKSALDATVQAIKEALIAGDKIALVGFGTFSVSERPAREGINPATKEKIQIAAKKVAKFKAGAELADALN